MDSGRHSRSKPGHFWMFRLTISVGVLLTLATLSDGSVSAADNPRHIDLGAGLTGPITVEQNWTNAESNEFYNKPQGSRILPYNWFLHLEQPGSTQKFRDNAHIRSLGYLARTSAPDNPDGLPVGFIKDASYEDGTPGLGLTCAACHTAQINYQGKAYLIDGAPTQGDFERLMKRLAAALTETAQDKDKFQRFSRAVLGDSANILRVERLRRKLKSIASEREGYNQRNLPKQERDHFGPGRVDAFGAILNEVSSTFLGIPGNLAVANAPVSYPCLWDAPQHEVVQWNGAAKNRKSPPGRESQISKILFGTTDVGALGRNAGEVLGVFGSVDINSVEVLIPLPYHSTVNRANLIDIEESLKRLWSPEWPSGFNKPLDAQLITQGRALFKTHCIDCHADIDRKSSDRVVKEKRDHVGTDPTLVINFAREVSTGQLKGRRATLLDKKKLGAKESAGVVLRHVVERTILRPQLLISDLEDAIDEALNLPRKMDGNAFNPGFQQSYQIETRGGKKLSGLFDSVRQEGTQLRLSGGQLQSQGDDGLENVAAAPLELESLQNLRTALPQIRQALGVAADALESTEDNSPQLVINDATPQAKYKARPLNGIWATAPYLHNGSVPTLTELLKKSGDRKATFHVGGLEFDPVNVGFVEDMTKPLFDTSVTGNSNKGHEYGVDLSHQEKKALIEYLKSL
jgi:hypothetical protein